MLKTPQCGKKKKKKKEPMDPSKISYIYTCLVKTNVVKDAGIKENGLQQ